MYNKEEQVTCEKDHYVTMKFFVFVFYGGQSRSNQKSTPCFNTKELNISSSQATSVEKYFGKEHYSTRNDFI